MTVWFDFALKGVTGLYLPTIMLVDGRQFEVQGRKMDRDDLIRWLEQYKLRDRPAVIRLYVSGGSQLSPDILKLLRGAGATDISIRYE